MQECKNGGLIVAASRRTWSIARNEQWYSTDETGGGIAGAVTVPLAVRPRYASPKRASSVAIWSWDRSISRDSLRLFCIDSPNDGPFPSPTFVSMLGPAVDGGPGGPGGINRVGGSTSSPSNPQNSPERTGSAVLQGPVRPRFGYSVGMRVEDRRARGLRRQAERGCVALRKSRGYPY